jgi:hypothetical protein
MDNTSEEERDWLICYSLFVNRDTIAISIQRSALSYKPEYRRQKTAFKIKAKSRKQEWHLRPRTSGVSLSVPPNPEFFALYSLLLDLRPVAPVADSVKDPEQGRGERSRRAISYKTEDRRQKTALKIKAKSQKHEIRKARRRAWADKGPSLSDTDPIS